jgi:hypothetical protein
LSALRTIATDLGLAVLAVFGTAFVLAFASGVVEGAVSASDVTEVITGVVFGGLVLAAAALAIAFAVTPQLLRLREAWRVALEPRGRGAGGPHVLLAIGDGVVTLALVGLGALRYRQGLTRGEEAWVQQGALLIVGGLILGGGAVVARVVSALRAPGRAGEQDDRSACRADQRRTKAEAGLFAMTFFFGLGLALAMGTSAAIGELRKEPPKETSP